MDPSLSCQYMSIRPSYGETGAELDSPEAWGKIQANITPPLPETTYCLPSNSYVIGEVCIEAPVPECQSVLPVPVSKAKMFPSASPVNVSPESVVNTPAPAPPGPNS